MRVIIRADSSSMIGSGHVMRCLCLARAWRKQGHEVAFWCRPLPGDMRAYIFLQGFTVHDVCYDVDHSDLSETDAVKCLENKADACDLAVVDHYGLDRQWERRMRAQGLCVMALDDLASRDHDCDILLDQNVLPGMSVSYAGLVPSFCRQLLGPAYSLLSHDFQHLSQPIRYREQVRRLLLFFGGGDPGNVTGRVLEEVASLGIYADVVIGASNPNSKSVLSLCEDLCDDRCALHIQTNQMAALMASADLMLCAGGSAHWERCRLGLPALVTSVAQNQTVVSNALAASGTCVYLGEIDTIAPGAWRDAIAAIIEKGDALASMQAACLRTLPDGKGCDRVVKVVEEVMSTCK